VLTGSQDGIVKFWKRTSVSSPSAPTKKSLDISSGGGGSSNKGSAKETDSTGQCLEFIKSYTAHTSPLLALVTSLPEGDIAASVGEDNVVKFYDVGGFDVTGMIQVKDEYKCGAAVAFIGEDQSLLAVSSMSKKKDTDKLGVIYIFSSLTLSPVPVKEINLHAAPLTAMGYNYQHHCMISADEVSKNKIRQHKANTNTHLYLLVFSS
jgi:WD40 repeat protein